MSKLRRKDASKELTASPRLSDHDIDTSDIPEIRDWRRAILGRFYKPGEQQNFPPSSDTGTIPNDLLVGLGDADPQSTIAARISEMTQAELVKACVDGTAETWSEFIRRFHRLIANTVIRTAHQWGIQTPEHINDLIHEVYLHLIADNSRLLKKFTESEKSVAGYLKVVTANLVHDHFRVLGAAERNADIIDLAAPDDVFLPEERKVFIEEIDNLLRASTSERDRSIFWLYYRHGLTASEIAAIPEINLSIKGVESLIYRLTHSLRSELTKQHKDPEKASQD